uniref:baseplate J/gp47 family protein n=1 Tax=Agathobacter sp. TaxID=2021311 RepID=UPI0040573354
MLNTRNLEDKTYEELLMEALMQIPLYSDEWTNFNPSDPGVTILENLTAFAVLQQAQINRVTPGILWKLLKLAGFEAKKGRCARVLLAAEDLQVPVTLPVNQKFMLGNLCFETNKAWNLPACHLIGVYGKKEDRIKNYSWLLDKEVRIPASVFGEKPKAGDSLWITMDTMPPAGESILFSIAIENRYNRNPFKEIGNNTFAVLEWECYTRQGFLPMKVRDMTDCFLVSGEVRMRLPDIAAVPCPEAPDGGYAIRATLTYADYDVQPKLVSIVGFLFEAWQKETKSVCQTFNRITDVTFSSDLLKDGYVQVFCKEEKGASYKLYEPFYDQSVQGRFFEQQKQSDCRYTWRFDRRRFGYGPEKLKNSVKIMVYSEEIMRQYSLGKVLGRDNQEILLPVGHIVPESFCMIAKREDESQEPIYDFVRPSRNGEEELTYFLYEKEGKIVIKDAGDYIGADLYIGSLSVTGGEEGNVREANRFKAVGPLENTGFYNPAAGEGGTFRESLEEVKHRFLQDLKKPYAAVTASDYERLVAETPGLCIEKVRAFMHKNKNKVQIAVKPGTDERFPKLSNVYQQMIKKQLEDKRLLTTRIELVQPVYAAVDVHGTIYAKRQFENSHRIIEQAIRNHIDFSHSERNFGEIIRFDELFRKIEALDCVAFIYELSMHSRNPIMARLLDSDIVPEAHVLCYVDYVELQIKTL